MSDEVPGSSGSWDTGVTGCSGRGCTEGGPFAEVVLKGGCGIFGGSRAPSGAAEAVRAGIRVAKKEKKKWPISTSRAISFAIFVFKSIILSRLGLFYLKVLSSKKKILFLRPYWDSNPGPSG